VYSLHIKYKNQYHINMHEHKMVSKRIDITLDGIVIQRLIHLAKIYGTSKSGIIAQLINEKYMKNNKK